jgi:hypothetical protein
VFHSSAFVFHPTQILSKPGFRRCDTEEAFNNLSRILKTIKDCPIPQFKSQRVVEILAKYSTPEGAKQGNAILPERTVYDHWQTIYSGACITSIFNIIIRFQATSSWKDIVPHLIAAWPSTQIALQLHGRLLFDKNRPQFSLGVVITRMNAFNSIVTLIQGYSLHNPLADLVRKTPAAVDMVIKLWGLEVRDAEIQAGLTTAFPTGFVIPPGASISLKRFAFTVGDGPENTIKWGPLFATALGGTLAENASLVLVHIHATLARTSPLQTGTRTCSPRRSASTLTSATCTTSTTH